MEIKRRLNKLASRLSPQIEVMNVATEMSRMCDRFEELLNYAQEKIDRTNERKGNTIGKQVAEKRAAADKEVEDQQMAEANENLRDQKEAFDERNKIVEKSQRTDPPDEETNEEPEEPIKKAAAKKKAKKKKKGAKK